ncbi:Na+-transporting NADH:ubiquinone oxidoreductase, subunit NqrB [Burkholderiales bacterium JOSHI_001]|nr:Na+-transporting NADH:ubiquinone oxidoreductase, subunit NqrB [Burkholderiales bacterium JOSHI_001]
MNTLTWSGLVPRVNSGTPRRAPDARWFQIGILGSLLLAGALWRDFALLPAQVALTFAAALATQAAALHALKRPERWRLSGYLSAWVSALGISLLVRADSLWVHPLLAALAMASKFALRAGPPGCRSHVINPANGAAFAAALLLPGAWLSPGQWGSQALLALWVVSAGLFVTGAIARRETAAAFLLTWGALLALRLAWLGHEPLLGAQVWLHQVANGATLLFAFFMVTDPMTTPQHRTARIAYAVAVALAAFAWQFVLFKPHALVVALFAASWGVPWINRAWPQRRFEWREGP